ncbi:FISUMP domain-containing protein [uncultured Fibrobacter sp.]|uniref:FISUMP domain-containing protein n=1 Tax=uncultured Fibrobacter sp. TaxID=261512 RepID=UPI002803C137|nr:FISUMP domain-containing protein [uncultured Fibrobacter sp.]
MNLNLARHFALYAISCAALLAACADENTTQITEQTGLATIASGESLAECSEENSGEMVFVSDSSAVYYCDGSVWQTLNGKDGKDGEDGTDGSNGNSGESCLAEAIDGGYKIVCGGDSVGVLLNGKNGSDGENGENGADGKSSVDTVYVSNVDTVVINQVDTLYLQGLDGASCTAEPLGDASGYKIVCGGDSVGVLLNGKDGEDGKNATVSIPSELYDCESGEYNCVTTKYLNPAIEYGELLDTRDNRVYRTVKIGNQEWMAQNLAYEDQSATISLQGQMWCYYDSAAFCETYGRLYSWSAAMGFNTSMNSTLAGDLVQSQHRGICPEGFHIPSAAEWDELAAYVDAHNGAEGVGTSLKSPYLFQMRDSIPQGTDLFGFAGLPGDDHVDGQKSAITGKTAGYDDNVGRYGSWWSSSESAAGTASRRYLIFRDEALNVGTSSKADGKSVRCLRDF